MNSGGGHGWDKPVSATVTACLPSSGTARPKRSRPWLTAAAAADRWIGRSRPGRVNRFAPPRALCGVDINGRGFKDGDCTCTCYPPPAACAHENSVDGWMAAAGDRPEGWGMGLSSGGSRGSSGRLSSGRRRRRRRGARRQLFSLPGGLSLTPRTRAHRR